jgi:hypothetical protein
MKDVGQEMRYNFVRILWNGKKDVITGSHPSKAVNFLYGLFLLVTSKTCFVTQPM